MNAERWKALVRWSCNIACCGYFFYQAVRLAESRSQDGQLSTVLATAGCCGLGIMMLLRPTAGAVTVTMAAMVYCGYSKLYPLLIDFDPASAPIAPRIASIGMAISLVAWTLSACWLGRSFAILPARRQLRTAGPYAIVRHPIYASYICGDLSFLLLSPSLRNGIVVALAIAAYVARINLEEQVWADDPAYSVYRLRTRSRLIPFIY